MIGQALYLAAPVALCGILHMVVVKRGLFARLATPLDGGRTFGGAPVFGPNKTWRGVWVMIAGTALLGGLQGLLASALGYRFPALDFGAVAGAPGTLDPLRLATGYGCVNAVIGLGYVLGELPNSFFKRRLAIVPGKVSRGVIGAFFFLLDQADSVLAGLLLCRLFFGVSWALVLTGIAVLTALHLAINGGLYLARVRRNL
jgi:hypothetical protein